MSRYLKALILALGMFVPNLAMADYLCIQEDGTARIINREEADLFQAWQIPQIFGCVNSNATSNQGTFGYQKDVYGNDLICSGNICYFVNNPYQP